MTSKRADLLEPGDLLPAWGPDLLVTRVRPPKGSSPLVLVTLEAPDGTSTTVEYGPGTVVEISGSVPYETDEPETVTEADEIPDADPSSDLFDAPPAGGDIFTSDGSEVDVPEGATLSGGTEAADAQAEADATGE